MPKPRKQLISLDATPYYHSALASCVALPPASCSRVPPAVYAKPFSVAPTSVLEDPTNTAANGLKIVFYF